MQALVVLVTRVADLPIRVPLDPLIEVIYRVVYDLRLQSVKFNHQFQGRTHCCFHHSTQILATTFVQVVVVMNVFVFFICGHDGTL